MLILSRREGEALQIGEDVYLKVTAVDEESGQIRIGIEAPKSVKVHRQEVFNRINSPVKGVVITHKRKSRLHV